MTSRHCLKQSYRQFHALSYYLKHPKKERSVAHTWGKKAETSVFNRVSVCGSFLLFFEHTAMMATLKRLGHV